ncbi:MAG: PhoH family protein [Bacteroidetes bacterium]|nr:PhoH family protein [Bacteroidota bacterium]
MFQTQESAGNTTPKRNARAKVKSSKDRKIFVLDTSVILYDHNAINCFQEHDVVIPITVLEELDNFKKGNDMINYEARGFIRILDDLSGKDLMNQWTEINGDSHGKFMVAMGREGHFDANEVFGEQKADHRILNSALAMQKEHPHRKVVMVTKDINLRLKAKSVGLHSEDYTTGKVKDIEKLDNGFSLMEGLNHELIDKIYRTDGIDPSELGLSNVRSNHYFILKNGKSSVLAFYNPISKLIEKVEKRSAYGITPRNAEQAFALHAVLNPNVRLVSLMGVAGTGKTLLALAGAMERRREFRQIYMARPVVPLSNKDIGYLPGDIKSKLDPYMQPLWDNLKFIQSQFKDASPEQKTITEMVESEKLLITPLAYIRGRSLSRIIFIVDEAQNLTPHEVKTIITRAGEETKIIFTGDVRQIDTPYLDSESNGLSYLVDKIKDHPLAAHVTLQRGERSELANLANELL